MRRCELAALLTSLVACVDERISIAPWELQVRSSFVAIEDGGVRVVLSNHDDVCAELRAFRCQRSSYSNRDDQGVWFDVWLPSAEPRKFMAEELTGVFRGRSPSEFFETKAQRGFVELVSKANAATTIVVDLEMDTGAKVTGRFVASSCAETAFVRPFGGIECVSDRVACDAGTPEVVCWKTTESCSCGGAQTTASCTTTDRSSPRIFLMTCACTGTSPAQCSMPGGPPVAAPTCCTQLAP